MPASDDDCPDFLNITGTSAIMAARLCNFPTGYPKPLRPAHINWINGELKRALQTRPNAWVDIIGYASRIGNANFNQHLSAQRCDEVMAEIKKFAPTTNFPMEWAKGASESGNNMRDNNGYWRAVEVHLYASKPPPPPPPPIRTHMKWSVSAYFTLMAEVATVAQFGVGLYKFRDDETGQIGTYVSPMFGVGGGIDAAKFLKWLKGLKDTKLPGTAIERAVEAVLKNPSLLANPYAAVKEIAKAIVTGAGLQDWTDFSTCDVYLPLTLNKIDGKTIANASFTPGIYQVQRVWVYGQVWYPEKSGKKMFGNHDLLSASSSGWIAKVPGLAAGFVGGLLLML